MSTASTFKFALREDLKDDKQFLPTRAHETDTGWDVRAAMPDRQPLKINPFQRVKIPLGIRSFVPQGWWYELRPRSSTFTKKHLLSLYGTIDESWEGELLLACTYIPELSFTSTRFNGDQVALILDKSFTQLTIEFGEALGQLVPIKRQEMEIIETSNEEYDTLCLERNASRGTGGFGSTGA